MALLSVMILDGEGNGVLQEGIVNTRNISSARFIGRVKQRTEEFSRLEMRDGKSIIVQGKPDQFLPKASLPRRVEK